MSSASRVNITILNKKTMPADLGKSITSLGSFDESLASLFRFDRIRITRLCEIVQYAFMFSLFAIGVGWVIDKAFAHLYPVKGDAEGEEGKLKNMGQVIRTSLILALQVVVGALAVFYVRKVIDIVPPIINLAPSVYIKHLNTSEATGEMALAVCFIGIQANGVRELEKIRFFSTSKE